MQLVWWPDWKGFGFYRYQRGMARIYRWSLVLGWIELRRWNPAEAGGGDER